LDGGCGFSQERHVPVFESQALDWKADNTIYQNITLKGALVTIFFTEEGLPA
jgi:hypothetical protein